MIRAIVGKAFSVSLPVIDDDHVVPELSVAYDVRDAWDNALVPAMVGALSESSSHPGNYFSTITINQEGNFRIYFSTTGYPNAVEDISVVKSTEGYTAVAAFSYNQVADMLYVVSWLEYGGQLIVGENCEILVFGAEDNTTLFTISDPVSDGDGFFRFTVSNPEMLLGKVYVYKVSIIYNGNMYTTPGSIQVV